MRPTDRIVSRPAQRTHGVVTRRALLAAGLTPDEIKVRLSRGTLIRVHPGVYRVGHVAPSVAATYLAAVLACGDGALLSGRAAGWWLGLVPGGPPQSEVTAPTERRVTGVRTHRSADCCRHDRWRHRGIPVTSVARTIVDLAGDLSLDDLALACHEAGIKYRTSPARVAPVLDRHPTAPGRPNLELVLGRKVAVTLSKLERRFRSRLREANLRLQDEMNRPASGRRVDCRWIAERLTVELDSFGFHNSRHSWERDRRREREAYARGDQIRRYTYGDVFEDPGLMLAELAKIIPAQRA